MGIDPGTNFLGYAILEVEGKTLRLIKMSVLTLAHLDDQQQKLKRIFERITEVIKTYEPNHLAIEAPFFGKNVQSMLKLGRAQGVAIAAAIVNGVEMTEYFPKKIKLSVAGNGNASKEQVAAMLVNILNTPIDNEFLDATDALAVAVCHHYQAGNPLTGTGKKHNGWAGFVAQNPDKVAKVKKA